jgi:putative two-component system response regulator
MRLGSHADPTQSGGRHHDLASSASARVLVVDDMSANRELLTSILKRDGYVVNCASDGGTATECVRCDPPDLVLMDVMMPGVDGYAACRAIKADVATRLVPVVLITASDQADSKIRGLDAGADDFVTKPFNQHELRARVRSLLRIKRYTDDLDSAEGVIVSLALTIEARDPNTNGHCHRLVSYATALGRALGLADDDLAALRRGAYLHDVGKVGVSDAILLKAGPLTRAEYEQMKVHTTIGDRLCGELRALRQVRPIVRHHHERLDGSGYPDGLRGDAIPLLAQITGIVDVFDALTTVRSYKIALPADRAYEELVAEAVRGWRRSDLVDVFIRVNSEPASGLLSPGLQPEDHE